MNQLETINKDISIEKINITSLEKINDNYIRIKGKCNYLDIDVITNGSITFDFNNFEDVEKIINYNGIDYLIAENIYGDFFLICLNTKERIIKEAKQINYIGDGLFGAGFKERNCHENIFDVTKNEYLKIPDNMAFKEYKDDVLVLMEAFKPSYEKHKEMVIDRCGNVIIPEVENYIRVINKTKFILDTMVIDLNKKTIIRDADLIMSLTDEKIIVLKNRKLFILNNELEIIKSYLIGETKRPWYISVNGEECITMTFKKKIKLEKYKPREEKNITVIINTNTDSVYKTDFIPTLSPNDVFKIKNDNYKQGLMNKKSEIILSVEWDNIKGLNDSNHKYFFLEKDEEYYIFNSENKQIKKVLYSEVKEFKDGLALCYDESKRKYHLIDEELNIVFELDHIGHSNYYYKNGILCYHSGSFLNEYDAYTIINKSGEVLMPSRKCRVKCNGFDLLEISDYQTGENYLFDTNNAKFVELQIDAPVVEYNGCKKIDFSKIPIQQINSNMEMTLLEENKPDNQKKLLLTKKKDIDN